MSLTDLVSGNFCPITGAPLKDPVYVDWTKKPSYRRKIEYNKHYRIENAEKIKERKERNKARKARA